MQGCDGNAPSNDGDNEIGIFMMAKRIVMMAMVTSLRMHLGRCALSASVSLNSKKNSEQEQITVKLHNTYQKPKVTSLKCQMCQICQDFIVSPASACAV